MGWMWSRSPVLHLRSLAFRCALMLMNKNESKLLTSDEVAQLLGVTTETINAWVRAQIIPAVRVTSRTRRFILSEVLEALQQQGGEGTTHA